MVMNRVQFQSGLSLPHFMELYGTEEKLRGRARANAVA